MLLILIGCIFLGGCYAIWGGIENDKIGFIICGVVAIIVSIILYVILGSRMYKKTTTKVLEVRNKQKVIEIPIDRQDYIKLTDIFGETTFEFKPIAYQLDYNEKDDGCFDNNLITVHCIVNYEGKIFSSADPSWSVADTSGINDIKETIDGISKVLSGELTEYHARFFDPCFFNMLVYKTENNYTVTTEYYLLQDDNKLKWIKFNSTLTKAELEKINKIFKKYDTLFPCRK